MVPFGPNFRRDQKERQLQATSPDSRSTPQGKTYMIYRLVWLVYSLLWAIPSFADQRSPLLPGKG